MSDNNGCVKPRFVDLLMYGVYYAIYDLIKKDTWKIVWKSGEIVFDIIKDEIGVIDDPFKALKRLAGWLKEMGYVEYIEVRKIGENKIEYIMKNPIIASSAKKLIESERIPPHISTWILEK